MFIELELDNERLLVSGRCDWVDDSFTHEFGVHKCGHFEPDLLTLKVMVYSDYFDFLDVTSLLSEKKKAWLGGLLCERAAQEKFDFVG